MPPRHSYWPRRWFLSIWQERKRPSFSEATGPARRRFYNSMNGSFTRNSLLHLRVSTHQVSYKRKLYFPCSPTNCAIRNFTEHSYSSNCQIELRKRRCSGPDDSRCCHLCQLALGSPSKQKSNKKQCLKTLFSDYLTHSSNTWSFKLGSWKKKREWFWDQKALHVPFKGISPEGWNKILQRISIFLYIPLLSIFFMAESVSAQFVHISV